ncbi:MAG: hypothetical protein JJ855_11025 [Rhodospirillales bacterium]|nr:hypothetical protein [Rhodospirillales bacterium]
MLQQKLEDASRAAQRRRLQALIAILGATVFVALFVGGVIKLDFSILSGGSEPDRVASSTPVQSAPPSVSEPDQATPEQNPVPETESATAGLETNEATPLPPQVTGASTPAAPAVNAEELREDFKAKLGAFEENLAPLVDAPEFKEWAPTGVNEVQSNKDAAISAFSSANYEPALAKIGAAIEQAEKLIDQRNSEFDKALAAANKSLANDDFENASIEIGKALRLKPSSDEAANLKSKIDHLPEVLAAIEQAAIARTENNLEKELQQLESVIELDPDRAGIAERHEEVARLIKEEQFAAYIDRGLSSVEERDLSGARANLKKARAIFPDKDEAKVLAIQLETLRKELRAEQLITDAVEASKKDDWVTAEKFFKEAGQVLPDNKDAADGATLASTINGYRTELNQHLSSPYRLSSGNVSEIVTNLIANAEVYGAFSPTLAKQIAALKDLQAAYSSPVHITVLSDGETKVTVRGVGIVGNHKVKIIELKPGKYMFEGARPGFQSKIVELEVPPGAESLSVKVICDERI